MNQSKQNKNIPAVWFETLNRYFTLIFSPLCMVLCSITLQQIFVYEDLIIS